VVRDVLATSGEWWEATTWSSAAWAAVAAWATFGVLAGSLWFAGKQVREARDMRREQARPFVLVDLTTDFLIELEISNSGATVARNVQMTFSPPLASTLTQPWPWQSSSMFTDGIPTLAPGRTHRLTFDDSAARLDSDLPRVHRVRLTYTGPDDYSYEDEQVLDLNVMEGTRLRADPGAELARHLKAISSTLRRWHSSNRLMVDVQSRRQRQIIDARDRARRAAERQRRERGRVAAVREYIRVLWREFRVRHVWPLR
jgi:hypothetical protein